MLSLCVLSLLPLSLAEVHSIIKGYRVLYEVSKKHTYISIIESVDSISRDEQDSP